MDNPCSYKEIYREENENAAERYALVTERIRQIAAGQEAELDARYRDYFQRTAQFLLLTDEVLDMQQAGALENRPLKACEQLNKRLYADLLPGEDGYARSYANPAYAVEKLGGEFGGLLCFVYTECRALIPYAFEGRRADMVIFMELFVEIHTCFCDAQGTDKKEISQAVYWFFHDYSELMAEQSVREMVDPKLDFFTGIVKYADLEDPACLYRYGEYISENELRTAEFLNRLPQEQIQAMADTFTEGYRIGFEVTGKDLSKKKTVGVHYAIGFERVVRAAAANFAKLGLDTVIYRDAVSSMGNRGHGKRGCYSTSPNRQFDFDHRNDKAYYLDKAFVERRKR